MASLEYIANGGRDCYRLRFSLNKKRHRVGLGEFDEPAARIAMEHIDHLIGQYKRDRPPNAKTSAWLDSLPIEIHDRLSTLKLVEARRRSERPRTLLAFMRAYIAERTDWKKPENYKQSVNHLETFLKRDAPLDALSKGDAERWQRWMISDQDGPDLSPNTAGQHVKRCRQMMRQAIDDGLIEVNPFVGVKVDLRSDSSKNRFITEEDALAILDACPDQQWRTIFALCRWAGLRCPSEVTRLEWSHINWGRQRMTVTSPKTQRYGKGTRVVPLWPEIRRELDAAWDLAGEGERFVIARSRTSESNLRTTLSKIVQRAGVSEFAKPFMHLRRSRRTECERSGKYAHHVLNEWFGHDGRTAAEYYLDVTEDDFAAAIVPTSGSVGTIVGTSAARQVMSAKGEDTKKTGKTGFLKSTAASGLAYKYTPEDSNL